MVVMAAVAVHFLAGDTYKSNLNVSVGVDMTEPVVASKTPIGVDVEAGKTYWWCSCGLSTKQPFCDGSHKATSLTPVKYDAPKSGKVWFCGCKKTGNAPLCDASHKQLT
jgi:CDGSH iron-sulfur domain-containing protein 3